MAVERDTVLPAPALLHRVSWGAIFAGAIIAVALTALLSLLGLGIGLGSLDVAAGDSVEGAPKATLIWWAVTSILATGIGAFVAARLAGIPRTMTGALHGLSVWAVATLITLWLATSAAGFALGAATNIVTTTARVTAGAVSTVGGAAASAGGAAIPSPSSSDVSTARQRAQDEATNIGRQAGIDQQNVDQAQNAIAGTAGDIARNPGQANQYLQQLVDRLFEGPDAAFSPQERDRLITAIANRAGVSRPEAERIADRWQAQATTAWANVERTGGNVAGQAEETAVNVADTTVDTLSKVAWGMFLISLAGLVAALIGSAIGGATLGGAGAAARDHDYDHDRSLDENRHNL